MIFSRYRLAACIVALTAAGAAHAQQRPAPAPAPATAQPGARILTDSQVALGRELAILSGVTAAFDRVMPQFTAQIRRSTVTRPELAKDLEQVLDGLKPELEQHKQEMITATGRLYAAALTEAELKDVVTFFKTPSGRKYLEISPRTLDRVAFEMQGWAERLSQTVMDRVRTEMGKRGHQLQ
ncbi:MAG TPA: DUF2059 domain-containing protein [Beijerinckiaceae bacterium]|jgi:hypothetical protein